MFWDIILKKNYELYEKVFGWLGCKKFWEILVFVYILFVIFGNGI